MASNRSVVSALASAASAWLRDLGGSGNALALHAVSASARSTIRHLQRESTMNLKAAAALLSLLVCAHAALAADSTPSTMRSDPVMERYNAAAERQDGKSAAGVIKEALDRDPAN